METVEKQLFDSVTLTVDGRRFLHCTLINCELRYSGGEFEMMHTSVSDCRWAFGGPARRTMEVLETFDVFGEGLDKPDLTTTASYFSNLVN